MRFKEIREIREVNDNQKEKENGYLKIKPETDITYEEACSFWENLFINLSQGEES